MPAEHSLTIPQAFDKATETNDFQLMRVVSESLLDLLFQIEQLPSNEDKAQAISAVTQNFHRPQQRPN